MLLSTDSFLFLTQDSWANCSFVLASVPLSPDVPVPNVLERKEIRGHCIVDNNTLTSDVTEFLIDEGGTKITERFRYLIDGRLYEMATHLARNTLRALHQCDAVTEHFEPDQINFIFDTYVVLLMKAQDINAVIKEVSVFVVSTKSVETL